MAADVGLLIRGDDLVNRVAAPTKFAEYLACGLPVVVSRGVGDTESVVRTYGVGYVIEGLSDESISEVAQQIVNDRDRLNSEQSKLRCAQVAENLHSWSSQLEALLGAYRHAEQPDAK
jgi:glycosyltransferase involved in cell wall biosynthesis